MVKGEGIMSNGPTQAELHELELRLDRTAFGTQANTDAIREIRRDLHQVRNAMAVQQQRQAVINNDSKLVKKIVFATCGMVLTSTAGLLIKTAIDREQAQTIQAIYKQITADAMKRDGGNK